MILRAWREADLRRSRRPGGEQSRDQSRDRKPGGTSRDQSRDQSRDRKPGGWGEARKRSPVDWWMKCRNNLTSIYICFYLRIFHP